MKNLLIIVALLLSSIGVRAWEPPIGIPEPNWPTIGNPIEAAAPVPPDSPPPPGWNGQVPNRYYVDPGHSSATDSENPYGYPTKPRRTPPNPLPAGAAVYTDVWDFNIPGYYFVKGGGTSNMNGYPGNARFNLPVPLPANSKVFMAGTCTWDQKPPNAILAQGTATQPVWITNYDPENPAKLTGSWSVGQQSSFLILDGLQWDWSLTSTGGNVSIIGGPSYPTKYICIRGGSTLGRGTEDGTSIAAADNQTSMFVDNYGNSWDTATEQIVIHDVTLTKGGMWKYATGDPDGSGIVVGLRTRDIWVVDCEASYFSGGAYGFGVGTPSTPDDEAALRCYMGRNVAHHTAQFGFWSKRSKDCVMSQNVCHSIRRDTPSAPDGGGYGGQYGQLNFWIIYNTVYGCQNGITFHGAADDTQPGVTNGNIYIIGNVIYDIHDTQGTVGPFIGNGDQCGGVAISVRQGAGTAYIVNNTLYNYDGGINTGTYTHNRHVIGNIFAGRNTSVNGFDTQFIRDPGGLNTFNYNLLSNTSAGCVLRIAGTTYSTIAAINGIGALKSSNAGGMTADVFTRAETKDFTLKTGSPAIDSIPTLPNVYTTFEALYGRSIRADFEGSPRPQGAALDMGAIEHSADTIAPPHLRITPNPAQPPR